MQELTVLRKWAVTLFVLATEMYTTLGMTPGWPWRLPAFLFHGLLCTKPTRRSSKKLTFSSPLFPQSISLVPNAPLLWKAKYKIMTMATAVVSTSRLHKDLRQADTRSCNCMTLLTRPHGTRSTWLAQQVAACVQRSSQLIDVPFTTANLQQERAFQLHHWKLSRRKRLLNTQKDFTS